MLAWTVAVIVNLISGPPLGHDESAYAVLARGDAPSWLYRSRGMAVLAAPGLWLGGADWQMRLGVALVNLALIPAVFAVGRAVFDARTGAWAAAVIAGALPMMARSAELLGDLPATVGLLFGVALLAGELARDTPRWRLLLAAPAFAAAFYLRYGSTPVVAIAVGAAGVLWPRALLTRPALATAALLGALLVPHAVFALQSTGDALGVLRLSAGVPRRAYIGEGLVTYVTTNPLLYYGVLVTLALVAALVSLPRQRRAGWFVALVALGQLITIGLQSHAQPRYVFPAVALLTVLGVAALRRLARPRFTPVALFAVTAAWLGATLASVVAHREAAGYRTAITAAAGAIVTHRAHPACAVLGGTAPMLTWYTGCLVVPLGWSDPALADRALDRFVVSTPYAPFSAPTMPVAPIATHDPRVQVWRIQ